MPAIFLTGFPGFLGSELLPRLVARSDDYALCLVQPKFRALAEERVGQLGLGDRIRLADGDLTAPLDHIDAGDIREIWHLAAVYDLSVWRELGMRVNVMGTSTVHETIDCIAAATNRTVIRPLTKAIAKGALQYVPGVYRLMRIPRAAVDYFVHPTEYDTSHATVDLAGSGIVAPRLRDYAPRLVEFARAHPEIGSAAMV